MAAVTTTTTDTTTGDGKPRCGAPAAAAGAALRLLLPSVVVLGAMLGYPLVRLVVDVRRHGLPQVFRGNPPHGSVSTTSVRSSKTRIWTVLWRTLVFCFVNVALTMVLGVLVALLLDALGRGMRLLVSVSLIVAWAMPRSPATIVWQWMFDTEYGLANWALGCRAVGWANQLTFFFVATIIVVWMGIPFVAFTVRRIDADPRRHRRGREARWRRLPRHLPLRRRRQADPAHPDRTLGDLGLPRVTRDLQRAGGITRDTNLLGVYAYRISIGENRFTSAPRSRS